MQQSTKALISQTLIQHLEEHPVIEGYCYCGDNTVKNSTFSNTGALISNYERSSSYHPP